MRPRRIPPVRRPLKPCRRQPISLRQNYHWRTQDHFAPWRIVLLDALRKVREIEELTELLELKNRSQSTKASS
jgi:hypothetical protein